MNDTPLRVLLVEDNENDAILLREMFRREKPGSFELIHLNRMDAAIERLRKGGVDVVLLDLGLPDAYGLDPVRRARDVAPEIPLIILTGLEDENLAAQAMKEGAQDYLIKGQVENRALPRALRSAIERHRMQGEAEQLRLAQMQLKDEFLSHVSHELRSPLSAIHQFVSIMSDGLAGETSSGQKEYLNIIFRNVNQLQAMIDDLLEVTRIQEGKLSIEPQRMSAADAVAYTINTLRAAAKAKNITLDSNVQDFLPSVYADPARLRQVLIILVDNAIKYSASGGHVTISLEPCTQRPDFLSLEVKDTGPGLDAEAVQRIFDRLYQVPKPGLAGRQGLGLGLYIGKKLITLQGGEMWVRSAPQKGSTFGFTLPTLSLTRLISPLFTVDCSAEDSVALIAVELTSEASWMTKDVRLECSRQVRAVLQHCIHPALDVLLPKMSEQDSSELVYVLARASKSGARVLIKRISGHLEQSKHVDCRGISVAVTHRLLKSETGSGAAKVKAIGRIAGTIEDMIKLDSLERTIQHGPEEALNY